MKDRIKYVAISSFIKGMGSILDITSIQSNEIIREISSKTDVELLSEDWRNIGKDLSFVLKNYGNSIKRTNIENSRG